MCERKRRYMAKEDKDVQLAFRSYQLFYRIGTNSKSAKSVLMILHQVSIILHL